MKNFMKNKITQLVLILVVSLGLVLGFLLATNSIAEKNVEKRLLKQLEAFFPEVTEYEELVGIEEYDLLVKGYKLFTDGEEIGLVLEGKTTNQFSDKGFIHLMVGIAGDKTITGINVIEMDQSLGVADSLKNIDLYVGEVIGEIITSSNNNEIITGATYTLDSVNELMVSFKSAFDEYNTVVTDPYELIYGEGYELELDESFEATEHILRKEDVQVNGLNVGVIFTLSISGVYHRDSEGEIEMTVAIKDGKLLGYEFIVYEHTPGFQANVINFIERWIGTDLSSYPTLDEEELKTNSTNSTKMVDQMFRELRDLYINLGGGE